MLKILAIGSFGSLEGHFCEVEIFAEPWLSVSVMLGSLHWLRALLLGSFWETLEVAAGFLI